MHGAAPGPAALVSLACWLGSPQRLLPAMPRSSPRAGSRVDQVVGRGLVGHDVGTEDRRPWQRFDQLGQDFSGIAQQRDGDRLATFGVMLDQGQRVVILSKPACPHSRLRRRKSMLDCLHSMFSEQAPASVAARGWAPPIPPGRPRIHLPVRSFVVVRWRTGSTKSRRLPARCPGLPM